MRSFFPPPKPLALAETKKRKHEAEPEHEPEKKKKKVKGIGATALYKHKQTMQADTKLDAFLDRKRSQFLDDFGFYLFLTCSHLPCKKFYKAGGCMSKINKIQKNPESERQSTHSPVKPADAS